LKKIGNREPSREKKLQWKKFCDKKKSKPGELRLPAAAGPPRHLPAAGAAAPRLPAASREADPAAAAPEEPAAAPQPPCACLRHRIRSQDGWGRRPLAGLGREERPRRAAGRRASPRDAPPRTLLPAGRRSRALPRAAAEEAPCRGGSTAPLRHERQAPQPRPQGAPHPTSLTAQIQAAPHQGSRGDR